MSRKLVSVVIALLLGIGAVPLLGTAASAQVPPVPDPGLPPLPDLPDLPIPPFPPLPEPPDEAKPALGLMAPVTSPVCGTYGTAMVLLFLIGPTVGLPAGDLFPVFLPGLQVCGFFPVRATRSKCEQDKAIEMQLNEILAEAGQSLPVPPPAWPLGTIVDLGYALDFAAQAYAGESVGLGPVFGEELDCTTERVGV